jgi:hypothetical protein
MLNLPSSKLNKPLAQEIESALRLLGGYGSIEIYIQNSVVTQITVRNIKKTSVGLSEAGTAKKLGRRK